MGPDEEIIARTGYKRIEESEAVAPGTDAEPPGTRDDPPWLGPPLRMVARPLPLAIVLTEERDEPAIIATRFECYPSGFRFTLSLRRKIAAPSDAWFDAFEVLSSRAADPSSGGSIAGSLEFWMTFSDGSRVDSRGQLMPHRERPHPPTMVINGGQGGDAWQLEATYWVWPLPPPGSSRLGCAWRAEGIGSREVTFDTDRIREAANNVTILWE